MSQILRRPKIHSDAYKNEIHTNSINARELVSPVIILPHSLVSCSPMPSPKGTLAVQLGGAGRHSEYSRDPIYTETRK